MSVPAAQFVNITQTFGDLVAVDDISLDIEHGKLTTLLGPSGCGKTTSLRMLAGFSKPTSGSIFIEGEDCIKGFRSLAGATNPTEAAPGSIRGDLGRDWGEKVQKNIVHGSDSPESAAREIGIWFPEL